MADRYLVPTSGSVNWASTASWSATNGGVSGASVPVTGDNVYILNGAANINSGLSQTGVDLASLTVQFNGTIGTESTSLSLGAVTDCNFFSGSTCVAYIDVVTTGIINMYEGTQASVSVGTSASGGWNFNVADGTLYLKTTLTGGGSVSYVYGGNVKSLSSTTTSTGWTIAQYGGNISWNSPLNSGGDQISVEGGVFGYNAPPGYDNTNGVFVIVVAASGIYYHNTTGKIRAIFVHGATTSAAGAPGPFTVTNSDIYADGTLFQNPPVVVTYTNPTTKHLTHRSN